jgi:hypothetical protein
LHYADLRVTLGFNEYKCFCENKKPDWDTIFKGKEIKYLVSLFWIIIRIIPSDILRFNYSDLAKILKTDSN